MTTTLPVPTPVSVTQVPGIVAAVSGPFAWRLWWPVLPYLMAGALAWISTTFTAVAEDGVWVTWPSGVMLAMTFVAVVLLWSQGARFAVSLGHDRTMTFVATFLLGLLQTAGLYVVSLSVNLAELALLGQGGIHVFALETPPGKFGTHDGLWNATWVLGFWYVLPVLLLMVMTLCLWLRWRWAGLTGGVVAAVALPALVLAFTSIGSTAPASSIGVLPTLALVYVAPVVVAWFAFRRVAV